MGMSNNDKLVYQSIVLLDHIDRVGLKWTSTDNGPIKPLIEELKNKGLIIVSGFSYDLTELGKTTLGNFLKRYQEYLKLYDVFGFVDLDNAEFAFTKYWTFDSDAEWDAFKSNPRFEDIRIAVAMFKNLNPYEIVFMSFINENRFDTSISGWQTKLMLDDIWNEINVIVDTAYKPSQFGNDAMENMVEQGSRLAVSLIEEESNRNQTKPGETVTTTTTTTTEEVYEDTIVDEDYYDYGYYTAYYDPYYVSPFWLVPLIIF